MSIPKYGTAYAVSQVKDTRKIAQCRKKEKQHYVLDLAPKPNHYCKYILIHNAFRLTDLVIFIFFLGKPIGNYLLIQLNYGPKAK